MRQAQRVSLLCYARVRETGSPGAAPRVSKQRQTHQCSLAPVKPPRDRQNSRTNRNPLPQDCPETENKSMATEGKPLTQGTRIRRREKNNSETEGSEMEGQEGGPKETAVTFFSSLPFGGCGHATAGTVWDDGRGDGFDAQGPGSTAKPWQRVQTGTNHTPRLRRDCWGSPSPKGGKNPLYGTGPRFVWLHAQTPMQRLTDQQPAAGPAGKRAARKAGMRQNLQLHAPRRPSQLSGDIPLIPACTVPQ